MRKSDESDLRVKPAGDAGGHCCTTTLVPTGTRS
jgi:hypothetical protein